MFATLARMVPDMAFAAFDSSAATNDTLPSSSLIVTWLGVGCSSVPSGPFTTIREASTVTWTLSGTTTGYFAMRDMCGRSLHHDAEDFAAHARFARSTVRHHATG